ncbi:MAG TPA: hypothetical protein DCE47_04700 [Planctomycetaceae bacterium]|nr:hypothetical protein [Planctomycetaceae bacterium]
MVFRLLALLLLLSPAIGSAAPPIQPDNSAGRIAFNRLLEQAEAAWQESRTEEALRCYQIAKKVARTHKLELSGRDEALMAFITRHEAGQTHEQTGRQPGCETDSATAGPTAPATRPLPRSIPGPPKTSRKPIAVKGSAKAAKDPVVIPELGPANRPVIRRETRTLVPPVRPSLPDPPADSASTTLPPTADDPKPILPADISTTRTDESPRDAKVSRPGIGEAQPKTDADIAGSTDSDEELVPIVTPPPTETTAEQTAPDLPDDETLTPKTEPPAGETSPGETDGQQPVKLTADRQAVSIVLPNIEHPDSIAETDPVTSAGMPSASPGPISDRHLILMMFGPIVLALFLLGLLTQEMPSPRRIASWIAQRRRGPQPVAETSPEPTPSIAVPAAVTGSELPVTISAKRRNKVVYYTATIELPGVEPARIIKRRDGSPQYRSRAAALSSARHVARRLGYTGVREAVTRRKAA